MDIKELLNYETKGHRLYNVRRDEYRKNTEDDYNFRVSPTPFRMNKKQKDEILIIGKAICDYMDCCIELYKTDEYIKNILDRGKPDKYLKNIEPNFLFLRPDLILTQEGFSICEIETSPFGLGLAEVLNRTYGHAGFDPLVTENELKNYIQSQIPSVGTIAYSDKVNAFSGQMDFLADEIFSGDGKRWDSKKISRQSNLKNKEIYRAFYLSDEYKDKDVALFLQEPHIYIPNPTPQFEEKALLAFIWDKRYSEFFKQKLGTAEFELLRKVIPKTWIVGEEQYIDECLPRGVKDSISLSSLGKNSRKYVLKQSGFNTGSSWGEGVEFLHKMGGAKAGEKIKKALEDKNHLYIIQEFKPGKVVHMNYLDDNYEIKNMDAKIRITPYFSYRGKSKGKLIAIKVTGCEKSTEYIHAGTSSINTSVIEDEER